MFIICKYFLFVSDNSLWIRFCSALYPRLNKFLLTIVIYNITANLWHDVFAGLDPTKLADRIIMYPLQDTLGTPRQISRQSSLCCVTIAL